MVILVSFLFAAPALAGYEYPVQSPEIRDAYFLGERANYQTTDFLSAYAYRFTQPQKGEYIISEIDVLTPYAQIVQRGAHQTPGDSEVQVETDLRAHALRFLVKVSVYFNDAIVDATPGVNGTQGSGQTFSARLSQAHEIKPLQTRIEPIYGTHGPGGIILTLEFDPAKIISAPMHITVHTPDGRSVSADFDLSKLK
jgi:hypothetical protein